MSMLKTKRAGDLQVGDVLSEADGFMQWHVTAIKRSPSTVLLSLSPDPEKAAFCVMRPRPCQKRVRNGTRLFIAELHDDLR